MLPNDTVPYRQACPVKQVSAERLENFCLENLERISVDRNYIENLVFRLNNDFQARYGAGYELTEPCSKFSQFSADKIADTLNFFISTLKNSKGIERNLLAKRFLEKIAYSPESIKISVFASQNPQDFGEQKSPAPQARGGAEQSSPKNENPTFFENRKFASYFMAPNCGIDERRVYESSQALTIRFCEKLARIQTIFTPPAFTRCRPLIAPVASFVDNPTH